MAIPFAENSTEQWTVELIKNSQLRQAVLVNVEQAGLSKMQQATRNIITET
ncbi:MAG: hypothetical protein KME60_17515 [Cyanomargarita calcarea GSE-NOS-MK-12-04C]|uniref:Uncharacterized protein n=1 Tax=Cyanomargarita calcarea GSE-NOS-MK-12-04C TaxID=2839659 RepID=A0A951QNR6_9CYAN|nr:hypothetical protein [Cyanomargarita calcarea GSE-NOS-MK-12-04C]